MLLVAKQLHKSLIGTLFLLFHPVFWFCSNLVWKHLENLEIEATMSWGWGSKATDSSVKRLLLHGTCMCCLDITDLFLFYFLFYFLSLQSHLWIFPGLPDFHCMQRRVLNLIDMQLEFLFLHFWRNVIFTE